MSLKFIFCSSERCWIAFAVDIYLCISQVTMKQQGTHSSWQNVLGGRISGGEMGGQLFLITRSYSWLLLFLCSLSSSPPPKKISVEPFVPVASALYISRLQTAGCDPGRLVAGEGNHGLTISRAEVWTHCRHGVDWNLLIPSPLFYLGNWHKDFRAKVFVTVLLDPTKAIL